MKASPRTSWIKIKGDRLVFKTETERERWYPVDEFSGDSRAIANVIPLP